MIETKESIQNRILSNISDKYDKSEGSFFYDAEKPVAIELENIYSEQRNILNNAFVNTAENAWLDRKVAEQGIYRKLATKSRGFVTIKGSVGAKINKGDKVASDIVNFICLEDKTFDDDKQVNCSIKCEVECEVEGSIGNVPVGAIKYFPITLPGLISVTNLEKIDGGYEMETDDSLRKRYEEKVRTPPTSGNKYHYRNWATGVIGVGDAKVFPLWKGAGTVKIVIIDSNKHSATKELIDKVYDYVEENRPIGADVTVTGAVEKDIRVNAKVVLASGYNISNVQEEFIKLIDKYLKEVAFNISYISIARVGNILLNTPGVLDYSELKMNDITNNISLEDEEIPVLGNVELGV
ncbi:baseplate J/gp47 family protein [Clostridium oceanicum]|uniref:Baseplate J/gp47 family protein n=1 Tax=Clostridium oceanicum TaxID=1543 RepID=A0ABP3UJ40_9CLOT